MHIVVPYLKEKDVDIQTSNKKAEKIIAAAKEEGMVGLKGHRSVGGIRVSAYNAVSVESVEKLLDFLEHFESGHA
jgi:phosphoserine aminotransferase